MTPFGTTPRLSMEPTKRHRLIRGVESLHAARIQPTPGCSRCLHAEDIGAASSLHIRRDGSFKPNQRGPDISHEGNRYGRTAGWTSEGSRPSSIEPERLSDWRNVAPPSSRTRRSDDTLQPAPVTERSKLVDSPSSSVSGLDEIGITTGEETKPRTVAGSTSCRSRWRQPVSKERPSRIKTDR